MSIPLIQEATKDAINISIIAIKRNIERINMLLGLSNSEEIDTSKFATKEELQALEPVDEVAADNMHSVTSNAVAQMGELVTGWQVTPNNYGFVGTVIKIGKVVIINGRIICNNSGVVIISELPINKGNTVQNVPSAISLSDYTTVTNSGVISIEANKTYLQVDTGDFSNKQFNICMAYITE